MVGAIYTAVSGLQAASRRIEGSANNIANQFSTSTSLNGQVENRPYVPGRVMQVSTENGGVRTVSQPLDPAQRQMFDPQNPQADASGLVRFPNVDTAQELVGQMVASYDFKANLKTIQAADGMQKKLLDIIS